MKTPQGDTGSILRITIDRPRGVDFPGGALRLRATREFVPDPAAATAASAR